MRPALSTPAGLVATPAARDGGSGRSGPAGGPDPLDRLFPVARDLLRQVDATLRTFGVPPGDPLHPLLRQFRALPGEVVAMVAELRVDPLHTAADALDGISAEYARQCSALTGPELDWSGPAADTFVRQRSALADHLAGRSALSTAPAGTPDTVDRVDAADGGLAGRLTATAAYADAVAGWLWQLRSATAEALAEVLSSAEAVRFNQPDEPHRPAGHDQAGVAESAAVIGAFLLARIARVLPAARSIVDAPDELAYQGISDTVDHGAGGSGRTVFGL